MNFLLNARLHSRCFHLGFSQTDIDFLLQGNIFSCSNALSRAEIQKAFEFAYNPKTGVTNIAILFAIVVLSFTVAYVVINSKNTPIELN